MDFNILLILLLGTYALKLTNILMGATEAWFDQTFDKRIFWLGFIKQSGFCIGMLIIFFGGAFLPADIFYFEAGGISFTMLEAATAILFAFASESAITFFKKSMELHNLKKEDYFPSAYSDEDKY
ncbi:MAG: hypothetical protein ACRC37_07065 [Lentisphaeria bacterium]